MRQTLLLATVRQPVSRPPAPPTHHARTKSKLVRSNTPSLDITAPLPRLWTPTDVANDWIGLPLHFEIETDRLELQGYQIYAVEKWIVERDRPVTVLTVYTGDPAHKITVTALRPAASLSPAEATAEWEKAIVHLRRDARPRETPHGIVFATSLAHFRSDYTIVNIPTGDFLQARDQLYTNINLLRMGCSGRSALTLEEPSETTKDRFIATYHLPDTIVSGTGSIPIPSSTPASPMPSPRPSPSKHRARLSTSPPNPHGSDSVKVPSSPTSSRRNHASLEITLPPTLAVPYTPFSPTIATTPGGRYAPKGKSRADRATFSASVLELVRLIQAGLAIFGLFPADPRALDGLLCDKTVEGLGTWVTDVGEQCVANLEASERIADPAVVCALISLVLATRNKLAVTGIAHLTPKDPFLRPHSFLVALGAYANAVAEQTAQKAAASTPATPSFSFHLHAQSLPPTPGASSLGFFAGTAVPKPTLPTPNPIANNGGASNNVVLTRAWVDTISTTYSEKARAGERRKSRSARAFLGLDGELSDGSDKEGGDAHGAPDGQQILTGIGNLVRLNVGGSGSAGGAAGVLEASVDLAAFVKVVVGRGKDKGKPRLKGKAEGRPGEGEGGGDNLKEREKDAAVVSGVAGCVRGLWSGLVWRLVALREREIDGPAFGNGKRDTSMLGADRAGKDRGGTVVSDGDTEENELRGQVKSDRDGGRSTEEESGGPDKWGGRVQKKLESWTRLSRKKGPHASVDFSSGRDSLDDSTPTLLKKRPALPLHDLGMAPMTFSRSAGHGDDELSSGQVSPIDDPRTPRQFQASTASSAANDLNSEEYDRKLSAFNHKRPWGTRLNQNRISSWSDPVSAREMVDDEDESDESAEGEEGSSSMASSVPRPHRKRATVGSSKLAHVSILDEEEEVSVFYDEPLEALGYLSDAAQMPSPRRRTVALGPRRRRSWHCTDPRSFKDLKILTPERMRIDVALCGQVLVLTRREEHLRNVLGCVQVLTASLSQINAQLREDYQKHARALLEVEQDTKTVADIDLEASKAYKITQAQNTISYESKQLQIPELWRIASPPRRTTFMLRDKVFGMGGRRLPPGKHGAHGRFNRLQWTLDGQERLVDHLGRTESEAEEESRLERMENLRPPPPEDEEVVKHTSIRPMWLLRFFTSWGARWGAAPEATPAPVKVIGDEGTPVDCNVPTEEPQESKPGAATSPSIY
ncbi:hypothetical protein R3P38DRAFT_2831259 [Favolaschia claudopus]|uniref:STB6-like N-terminal domain-containing protein n=1 Tax=Favolaschia claudopus TaxID=2862362 RepID=A0AAW0EC22_9AGAR